MQIKIENNIYSKVDKELQPIVKQLLSYKAEYWKQGQYAKERVPYMASMVKRYEVFTGLIPKIIKHLENKKIKFDLSGYNEKLKPTDKPNIKGITFREDQLRLIQAAIDNQRGLIISPTGSGKTVIAAGLISCFKNSKVLFLMHTKDLLYQTAEEFKKFGLKNISIVGDGKKDLSGDIVVATRQTLANIDPKEYCDLFDITIVDECHHATAGQYKKILTNNLSIMKIGFTATEQKTKEKALYLEGLIGPVIGELSLEEGIEKGIIVKPRVTLISIPYKPTDTRQYYKLYEEQIIHSRIRNRIIIKEIKKRTTKNKSCLIMIKEIEHGENLMEIAEIINLKDIVFIQGKTEGEQRQQVKKALQDKKIKAVIVTAIWREGTNIPSVNCIVNAFGGKDWKTTMQLIGRGLRTFKGKEELEILDFIDCHRYLAEHFTRRLQIYVENNWL